MEVYEDDGTSEVPVESEEEDEETGYRSATKPFRESEESAESAFSSGEATVVSAKDYIERGKTPSSHPLQVPRRRGANLRDLARLIEMSSRFSHVTPEQIKRVRKMHDLIADGARFSFNYNVLLLVASILAALGLAADSSTNIIASMLVSPIMGPVVGMAYGSTIRDWKLVRKSFMTESISLVFCVTTGVVVAAICGTTQLKEEWPTSEMVSRGTLENFLVGLPVAFFSGLGVAVSLLDDQTSSLVGVAISASLLPPAVNAGVVWVAYAFFKRDLVEVGDDLGARAGLAQRLIDRLHSNRLEDLRDMGFLSLMLTLANIALIWIASMMMFRLKEVLPIEKKVFWNDLGVARKIYQKRALIAQVNDGADADEEIDEELGVSSTRENFVGRFDSETVLESIYEEES